MPSNYVTASHHKTNNWKTWLPLCQTKRLLKLKPPGERVAKYSSNYPKVAKTLRNKLSHINIKANKTPIITLTTFLYTLQNLNRSSIARSVGQPSVFSCYWRDTDTNNSVNRFLSVTRITDSLLSITWIIDGFTDGHWGLNFLFFFDEIASLVMHTDDLTN